MGKGRFKKLFFYKKIFSTFFSRVLARLNWVYAS
jgi:hypothetical protein